MRTENLHLIKNFAMHLDSTGQSDSTQQSYSRDARLFLQYLEQHELRINQVEPQTLLEYGRELEYDKKSKPNSIRRKIIGVRRFFRFLAENKEINCNPLEDTLIPERVEYRVKDEFFSEILKHLSITTGKDLKKCRDLAILSLIGLEGVKVSEVIGLQKSDYIYNKAAGSLQINSPKTRTIKLHEITNRHLTKYIEKQRNHPQSQSLKSALFIGFKGKDSSLCLESVTRHGIKHMVYQVGKDIGYANLNTEQLRHLSIDFQLAEARSPEEIMTHLGLRRLGNIAKHIRGKDHRKSCK